MKKKILFSLFSFLAIFSFNINVFAFSIGSATAVGMGVSGVLKYTYDNLCMDSNCINNQNFNIPAYDSTLSIFDPFGNDLPVCGENLYILKNSNTDSNIISINSNNSIDTLCNSGYSPSLAKIKEYFKYFVRINYESKEDSSMHYIYLISDIKPTISYTSWGFHYLDIGSNGFYISNFPSHYIVDYEEYEGDLIPIYGNDERVINHVTRNYYSFNDNFREYLDNTLYGTWWNNGMKLVLEDLNFDDSYFDVSISTNFDFDLSDYQNFNSNLVDSFEFNTDSEINIKYEEYALFIPKKNTSFSSYLWSDSNFMYTLSESYSSNGYNDLQVASLSEISYAYLNDYPYFKWVFDFTNDDLINHRVLKIFNHNSSNNLNIKYFSSDFEVRLMNKDSSDYTYNGFTYSNDWENQKNNSSKFTIKNVYSLDNINNATSFINNLPNLITSFGTAFTFIGTLITTAFSIFSSDIVAYFYILFGLMLIMLLILILR